MTVRVRPKYTSDRAFKRLIEVVRTVRPVDNDAIRFSFDGSVTFLPVKANGGEDTWDDL